MFDFDFILALNIQKVPSLIQIAAAFFTLAIYNSIFRLGNFIKLTFDSSYLSSKHVLFGCSKQPLVSLLTISQKIFRFCRQIATNGAATGKHIICDG